MAVRVCTDCHFSLQTVTVASTSFGLARGRHVRSGRSAARGGGAGSNVGDGDRVEGSEETLRRSVDGRGVLRRMLDIVLLGESDGDGDDVLAEGEAEGVRWGFVESAEAVRYATGDIAGDVTIDDVLEWSRIQVTAKKGAFLLNLSFVLRCTFGAD